MKPKVILFLILFLAFVLRLCKIDIPLADHHSWRQADTAAVARNYIKEGWNFLQPKIDNMIPLHPGAPNKERLFMVEPPVYNSLVAAVYKVSGVNIEYARLVSVFFSLGSIIFLYLLSSHFFGEKTGLLTSFFFAILPYNIFYSRVVMPEPMIIFLSLGMFLFLIKWLEKPSWVFFLLWTVFSAIAFSQKAFSLFLLLPVAYLLLQKFNWKVFLKKELYLWFIVSILPFVLWRLWVGNFPEGTPANVWLFNQGNIRFKGAFFNWIFAKRVGELILGYWGLPILILGLILKPKKGSWFFHLWLLSILIFTTIFAAGSVTHDYYQIAFIPVFSVFLAKGANFLLFEKHELFSQFLCVLFFMLCTAFSFAFSWYQIRDFYNIQGGVDLAGQAVDELTPKNALVLTGDSNDATLLYNTNRWGWSGGYASSYSNSQETIEKVKQMGGSFYVSTKFDKNSDFGKYMLANFRIMKETNQFIIFSLITNH